jgi:hypothetical protein
MMAMFDIFYKRFNLIYLTSAIFIFFFILNIILFSYSFLIFLLLGYLLLTHYFFFYYYLKYENSKKYFPILPLISFFFFISHTLVFFLAQINFFYKNYTYLDILPKPILVLILGLNFFLFGYIISEKIFSTKKKKIFYFDYNLNQKLFAIIFFIILSYLINFDQFCGPFLQYSFIKQLREPVNLFTLGLILIMILKNDIKSNFWHFLFALTFLMIYMIEISEAFISTIFCMIIFLLTMYFYIKKKIPIISIIFSIFLLFSAYATKDEVRKKTWFKNFNCSEKIVISLNILKDNFFNTYDYSDKEIKIKSSNKQKIYSVGRIFTNIETLNAVVILTPEKIPFFKGSSYSQIYSKFIPRFLWSDKPTERYGNFWGHRYFFLDPTDNITSWNFGVIPEFYANFGILGVVIGMFLLGILIKFLIAKLQTKKFTEIEILISSVIIFNFFYLEINLSLILGKVINQLIFFNIFFLFFYFFLKFIPKNNRLL